VASAVDIALLRRAGQYEARRAASNVYLPMNFALPGTARLIKRHADFSHAADVIRRRRTCAVSEDVGAEHEIVVARAAMAMMHEMIAVDGFHVSCTQQERDRQRGVFLSVVKRAMHIWMKPITECRRQQQRQSSSYRHTHWKNEAEDERRQQAGEREYKTALGMQPIGVIAANDNSTVPATRLQNAINARTPLRSVELNDMTLTEGLKMMDDVMRKIRIQQNAKQPRVAAPFSYR